MLPSLLGWLILLLVFSSCGIPFRGGERDRSGDPARPRTERSDPLAFPGDEVTITEIDVGLRDYGQDLADTSFADTPDDNVSDADGGAGGRQQGFDVQFFAGLNVIEARRVREQVDTLTSMPVRVVFEEPYYKVLAGPYPSFEHAEKFLRAVGRAGFSGAWIIARRTR